MSKRGVALIGLLSLSFGLAAPAIRAADRKSPEFSIGMPGGKQLLLSSYRGKTVVLAFILTTCPHCQAATGFLTKLQGEYGGRGLQVLESAIDVQSPEPSVREFVKRFAPNFPVGFSPQESVNDYLQHSPMLLLHVPTMVFIDRQGMIRGQFEGDDKFMIAADHEKNIRELVEKLLAPAGKAPAKKSPSGPPAAPPKKAT